VLNLYTNAPYPSPVLRPVSDPNPSDTLEIMDIRPRYVVSRHLHHRRRTSSAGEGIFWTTLGGRHPCLLLCFAIQLSRCGRWGGRWDLNPQPPEPQSGALAIELRPHLVLGRTGGIEPLVIRVTAGGSTIELSPPSRFTYNERGPVLLAGAPGGLLGFFRRS